MREATEMGNMDRGANTPTPVAQRTRAKSKAKKTESRVSNAMAERLRKSESNPFLEPMKPPDRNHYGEPMNFL